MPESNQRTENDDEQPTIDVRPRRGATNMWDALVALIMLVGVIWLVQYFNANNFDEDELRRGGWTTGGAVLGYAFQIVMAKIRNGKK